MRKRIISIAMAVLMAAAMASPAASADYRFETGGSTLDGFGRTTTFEGTILPDPAADNHRRNKDAAFMPPPFGVFSGSIATPPSSLLHDNLRESGFIHVNHEFPLATGGEDWAPGINTVTSGGFLNPSSQMAGMVTAPWLYEDGRLGTLRVERLNITVNVYEGETGANMAKGAGHISSTSAWDGNVALAGHNRGSSAYFSFVKDLKAGDKLTYTTRHGARTYEVVSLTQINEWSTDPVKWSAENILSLVTCIANQPELRYFAVARQVS